MLCLLFWSGSQRAVVVCCWFSIHACPSLSTLNELQHPPWTPTYLQHQLWAGLKWVLLRVPLHTDTLSHTCTICPLQSFLISLFVSVHLHPGRLCVLHVCTYSRTHTLTQTVISSAAEPATRASRELWEECGLTRVHRSALHMQQAVRDEERAGASSPSLPAHKHVAVN